MRLTKEQLVEWHTFDDLSMGERNALDTIDALESELVTARAEIAAVRSPLISTDQEVEFLGKKTLRTEKWRYQMGNESMQTANIGGWYSSAVYWKHEAIEAKAETAAMLEKAIEQFPQSTVKDVINSAYARAHQEGVLACKNVVRSFITADQAAALAEHDKQVIKGIFEIIIEDLVAGCVSESSHPRVKAALAERERKVRLEEAKLWRDTWREVDPEGCLWTENRIAELELRAATDRRERI